MLNNITGIYIVYVIVTIVISLSIHEAMHAYVAHALGDTTAQDMGRLSLNPLKHIDPFSTVLLPVITLLLFHIPVLAAKPVPFDPSRVRFNEYGSALIAAAGPLSNFVLAFLAGGIIHFTSNLNVQNFFEIFVIINIGLFVFNLIPIPPLDGSRVLFAFAPEPLQRIMMQIEPYGLFIVFGLLIAGVLTPLIINLNNDVLRLIL